MAKATYIQKINGKVYEVGEELPEYGSLKFTANEDGIASIEGNSVDVDKLPLWVRQGSQAYMVDNERLYKFDETNKRWLEQ